MSSDRYRYNKTVGAAAGRTGNFDDFLSTRDRITTATTKNADHGSVGARSRQSSTANRVFLSSKHDTLSTHRHNDDNRSDTEKGTPMSRTITSRDRQGSPRPSVTSFNGTTSPETSEMDKMLSLVKELKKIDIDNINLPSTGLSTQRLTAELEKKNTEYQALKEAYDSNITKFQDLEDKHEKLRTDAKRLIKEMKEKTEKMENETIPQLRRNLKEKEDEIRNLKFEKDSALSRLSKEMGEKLNDNNSGIADLSDPNRSTKIAEKYNSLYDNDWTDALEYLTDKGLDEETGVRFLLEIMRHVYSFCTKAKSEQIGNLRRLLDNPVSSSDRYDDSFSMDISGDKQINQLLENCIKMRSKTTIQNLPKEYLKLSTKPRYADRLHDYTNKCIEICWLMNTHSPPLVFAEPVSSGESYDKDQYKEFTKQGDTVSFIVWLPMLIEEKGAILSKGVVQPVPSVRSELNRGRTGSEKTKPEPKEAWTSDTSDMYRGRERETYDQQLKRMLRPDPSKRDYDKNFDSLRDFGSKHAGDIDKKYHGSRTYTKAPEQQVNDLFQDTRVTRSRYPHSSAYGEDDLQSTPPPSYQQYSNNYSSDTGLTHSKHSSSCYNERHRTEGTTVNSRPSKTLAENDKYSPKTGYGQEAGLHYNTRSAQPKMDEMFEHNGSYYAFYNCQMYKLDGKKWRPTSDL